MTLRDRAALEDMIAYCDRIRQYLERCGNTQEMFAQDTMAQDACCMCVVQIGELVTVLSDETKKSLSQIPWRLIKETRNYYVHNYGSISTSLVWSTVSESIPVLKDQCRHVLEEA